LHPAAETAVDNVTSGVQPLHPVAGTGCNQRADGVQSLQERGAAVAPEPSVEPSREPSAASAGACNGRPVENTPDEAAAGIGEFFAALGPRWLLTVRQRERLAPLVTAALAAGWSAVALAEFVGANTVGVRSPCAVLAARLSPGELPAPWDTPPSLPPWCGACDETTRMLGYHGDAPRPCPRCKPAARRHGSGARPRGVP
jgi:hypothetical protein